MCPTYVEYVCARTLVCKVCVCAHAHARFRKFVHMCMCTPAHVFVCVRVRGRINFHKVQRSPFAASALPGPAAPFAASALRGPPAAPFAASALRGPAARASVTSRACVSSGQRGPVLPVADAIGGSEPPGKISAHGRIGPAFLGRPRVNFVPTLCVGWAATWPVTTTCCKTCWTRPDSCMAGIALALLAHRRSLTSVGLRIPSVSAGAGRFRVDAPP
jgi:hypothetical protein